MNIIGLKEHIHYNFQNLRIVDRPSINELYISKDKRQKLFMIREQQQRNAYTVIFDKTTIECNSLTSLFTLLEYIN